MLNTIRAHATGLLAKLLLLLLILSFAVWGVGDMLRTGGGGGSLGTIGGQEIPRRSFERGLHNALEEMRQQLGKNYSPELVRAMHLERKVIDEIVNSRLLRMEAHALSISPPDEAVADAFRDDKGVFNKAAFQATARNNGLSEQALADEIRQQVASQLLAASIAAAAPTDDAMLRVLYGVQNEERTADVATLTPALIKDVPQPKDAEVQAYYDAHKADFTSPEYRSVQTLTLRKDDILKEQKMPPDQLAEAVVAISNRLEDMLAGGDSLEEAAGAVHARYALTEPFDRDGKTAGGKELKLPEGFADAAFAEEPGRQTPLKPNKDGETYVMLQVAVTQAEAPLPLEKVHAQAAEALHRQQVLAKLSALANHIASEMKASREPLSVLTKYGVQPVTSSPLKRSTRKPEYPLPLLADIFSTPTGSTTDAHETPGGSFVLAVVKSRRMSVDITSKALEQDKQFILFTLDANNAAREELLADYLRYLRGKYHVTVNRQALAAYVDADARQ